MRQNNPFLAALATAAVALTFGAGSASADIIIYDLTALNGSGLGPGPYVQVTVNETTGVTLGTSTAEITFTSLFDGSYLYLMGGNAAADIDVNGSFSLVSFTGSNTRTGFTPGPLSNGGSGNADGFGNFSQTIDSFDGYTHSFSTIVIDLAGGSWLSAATVLTDSIAAAHVFACTESGNGCASTSPGANSDTFYASNAQVVPIPAAAWLFGSGLVGLIGIARRKLAAPGLGLQGATT